MNLPPSLDRRCQDDILASSGGGLAGIAGRPMKRRRHLVADRAVRAHLVVVSTPSLAFSPCLVEAQEPVGVQALRPEFAVQAFDEGIVRRFARRWAASHQGDWGVIGDEAGENVEEICLGIRCSHCG